MLLVRLSDGGYTCLYIDKLLYPVINRAYLHCSLCVVLCNRCLYLKFLVNCVMQKFHAKFYMHLHYHNVFLHSTLIYLYLKISHVYCSLYRKLSSGNFHPAEQNRHLSKTPGVSRYTPQYPVVQATLSLLYPATKLNAMTYTYFIVPHQLTVFSLKPPDFLTSVILVLQSLTGWRILYFLSTQCN